MLDFDTIRDTFGLCMIVYILAYMCLLVYENEYATYHATATEVYRE